MPFSHREDRKIKIFRKIFRKVGGERAAADVVVVVAVCKLTLTKTTKERQKKIDKKKIGKNDDGTSFRLCIWRVFTVYDWR